MSERKDVIDPQAPGTKKHGLVYSEVLGWIDLGHARGGDITDCLWQMERGEASGQSYYLVEYAQTMMYKQITTGRCSRWNIKRGRTLAERHSITLALMMETAIAFENWQSMPFFSWYTDSGFSAEDLVSDLLGFYKVVRPQNYWPWLKIVSKEAALRRWDYYGALGSFKNRGFNPLLFPDPADIHVPHIPYKGRLPNFMMSIRPFTQFDSDIVRRIDAGPQVTVGWDVKKK
ncbi:MAG: DUF4056 domain-containing protein [Pantoea sp.]|nr:DUF4056 domain-containing protein [Pantoea sp.]